MARLSISLLGSLQINLDGQPVTGFESVKTQALLAYLAEEPGQNCSRSFLADLLWPERPDRTALNNLRHTLSNLRKVLHEPNGTIPFLLIDRESLALNPGSGCLVDTWSFRRLLNLDTSPSLGLLSNLNHLEQAAALYRGEFLAAFPTRNYPAFEEWILVQREFYRSQILDVLTQLAKTYLEQVNCNRAKDYIHRQLEIEPWKEEAHCQKMEMLALEGKRAEALAQFAVCCSVLRKELNVDPGPATVQLFERIRDGNFPIQRVTQPAPITMLPAQNPFIIYQPSRFQHNLPRSITSFVGRENEIALLKKLIHNHDLVTLTGTGGIGKSRLALETAHLLLGDFQDGIYLLDCAQQDDPSQVVSAAYKIFRLYDGSSQPTIAGLLNFLVNRQILLVLDNCDPGLKDCTDLVYAVLQDCPRVKIIATSREKLSLAGEEVFCVAPLALPETQDKLSPRKILDYGAVQLFVDRARSILPSFQLLEENLQLVRTLCQWLDGIPLAIELAASHLNILTLEQVVSRLMGSFDLLEEYPRFASPGHQDYKKIIERSYQSLSSKERFLLQCLSIFNGGCTLEAVESVCAGEEISKCVNVLSGLVNKSMLVLESQPGERRFRLLNMTQQYALEKLHQSGSENRLRANHCAYYAQLAQTARPHMKTEEQPAWIRKLDAELKNLYSAIRWAIDEGHDIVTGLQMVCDLFHWWMAKGLFEPVLMWLRKGISEWQYLSKSNGGISLRVEALCLLARMETDRDIAFTWSSQAMLLARELELENQQQLGLAFHTAGFLFRNWCQNPVLTFAFTNEARRIYERFHPKRSWEIGRMLEAESKAYLLLRDYPHATRMANESYQIFHDIGDYWYINPVSLLGIIAMEQRDYRKARTCLEEAMAYKGENDDAEELKCLQWMGRLEREQDNYFGAIARLRQAIQRSNQKYNYAYFINILHEIAYTEIEFGQEEAQPVNRRHLICATRLLGAAEACGSYDGLKVFAYPKKNYTQMVLDLRGRLGVSLFEKVWGEGAAMSCQQASEYALGYSLTARESDV